MKGCLDLTSCVSRTSLQLPCAVLTMRWAEGRWTKSDLTLLSKPDSDAATAIFARSACIRCPVPALQPRYGLQRPAGKPLRSALAIKKCSRMVTSTSVESRFLLEKVLVHPSSERSQHPLLCPSCYGFSITDRFTRSSSSICKALNIVRRYLTPPTSAL